MQRVFGLLLILGLIIPLFLGAAGVLMVSSVVGQVQATLSQRVDAISIRLHDTEFTINAVSDRFTALKGIADQVSASARAAAASVGTTMTDTSAHYSGVDLADGSSVPAANINVPGISSARGYLQNLYDTVASLSSAVADTTMINQIPGMFGLAVNEAQALSAELSALQDNYSPMLTILGVVFSVWMAVIYVALVFRWLRRGWYMLTGQTGPAYPIEAPI